jgi:putative membrane protein
MIVAHYGMGFGLLSGLLTLLLIALVILGIIALVRYLGHQTDHYGRPGASRPSTTRAQEILAERFARGEIDEEEYRRRSDHLRGASPPPQSPPAASPPPESP